MKRKHIFILVGVFLSLIAVNTFQKIHSEKKSDGDVRYEEWHPFIPNDKAARILFSREGYSGLALAKEGANWKVESLSGVSANGQKVTQLLDQLNRLKAELRAEGESLYERFGIADKQSFRIQILDATGAAIVDFWMGEHRAGRGVFIRLAGTKKIYFVTDDLPALFGLFFNLEKTGPQLLFFTDLKLVSEGFEQIQRFEIEQTHDGKNVLLASVEKSSADAGAPWKFVSSEWEYPVSHEKIEEYLTRVLGAHAENIETKNVDFKKEMEIMLRDVRGKILRLQMMRASDTDVVPRGSVSSLTRPRGTASGWLVKREGEAPIFKISDFVFDDLKTEDARLVGDNPLQLNLDEESTVELIHDRKKEIFSKVSGWPSAMAILDAAMRLQFVGLEQGVTAKDLAAIPPTHRLRVMRPGAAELEMGFYVTDPKLTEIKTVISGQDFVFRVSRDFFESIFVPDAVPRGRVSELTLPRGTASAT